MKNSSSFSILYFTLIFICIKNSLQGSLKAVQIVYRHGERNPIKPYPNDPYSNESYYWPEGWGSLKEKGKVQLYNLGRYMRKRYPNFQRKNVVIFTSDTNRTITCAMANIAGFYGQNRSILKQLESIDPKRYGGIQIIPEIDDDFISLRGYCPKWDQVLNDFLKNSEQMKVFKQRNGDAIEIINKNTGLNFTSLTVDLLLLVDTLIVQKLNHLELPGWAEQLDKSGKLDEIRDAFFPSTLSTVEMKRLKTGTMLKKFTNEMESVIKELSSKNAPERDLGPNITIISGHDATIAYWLIDLDIYDGKSPTYGSAIFMELHKAEETRYDGISTEKGYIFKFYYKNETDSEPYLMSIPGCANPCSFTALKTLLRPLIVDDRESECKLSQVGHHHDVKETLKNVTKTLVAPNTSTASSRVYDAKEIVVLISLLIITLNGQMYPKI